MWLLPALSVISRLVSGVFYRLTFAGDSFPIVPIGLVFRDKAIFRSEALAVVGAPVAWDDLVGTSPNDTEAVRELTQRIERSLRKTTLNLEQWEDRPVLECAEAIYAAEFDADTGDPDHARRLERLQVAADILAPLRREQG